MGQESCLKKQGLAQPSRRFFAPTGLNSADMGTRPVSLGNIDFNFRFKGLQFLLSGCKNWITNKLAKLRMKLKERVLKMLSFSVVVESKGIGEVLDCSEFNSRDKLLQF